MSDNSKVNEYLDKLEHDKIMIETQFADMESYIKKSDNIDYDKLVSILSHFNTLNIQYEQLCYDLTTFIKIFKSKEEQEIRIYKTEELVDLLEKEVEKVNKQ